MSKEIRAKRFVLEDKNGKGREMKSEGKFTTIRLSTCASVASLLILLLAGCVAPIRHYTPSGRPEVTINGRVGEVAFGEITNAMMNLGYNVKTSSATLLVFEKPVDNFGARLLLGSQYDTTPAARITFNIIETEGSTRIVASFAAVTNPGSAFERLTPMNNNPDTASYQAFLDKIRNDIELQQSQQKGPEAQRPSADPPRTSADASAPQRKIIGYRVDTSQTDEAGNFITVPVYEDEKK